MLTLRDLTQQFPGCREQGLTRQQVLDSLQRFGANQLTPPPREPLWRTFLSKFDDVIIRILLAATLLKTIVDLFESSALGGLLGLGITVLVVALFRVMKWNDWLPAAMFTLAASLIWLSSQIGQASWDGLAVMVAVVLATGVAFVSEYQSDKEFEILNTRKESQKVKVHRDGALSTIEIEDVVVGDLIALEMGDEVPADGRIAKANECFIDQSLLTGEPEPVRKAAGADDDVKEGPEQPDCVYRGTQVIDGVALMTAAQVGDLTMVGQIARRLTAPDAADETSRPATPSELRVQAKLTISKLRTPLQAKLEELAGLISKVGYAAAAAIFAALLVRGLAVGDIRLSMDAGDWRLNMRHLLTYFVYVVIVIVVAVPEGLPMSVTVSLALAMRKMTRANSLVRQLIACETIGSATIICSDKTGTLTQNKMRVERWFWDNQPFDRQAGPATGRAPLMAIALNSALNSTASLEKKKGAVAIIGNSTEGALLQWLEDAGFHYTQLRAEHPVLYQMHFSSERKRMTTVIDRSGRLAVLVKGAPEMVMQRCTGYLAETGAVQPFDERARARASEFLRSACSQSMRVLAFAQGELPADWLHDELAIRGPEDELEEALVFCGMAAIRDPLRAEVPRAMEDCRQAGIAVMMITGDNLETATAVAKEIGLLAQPADQAIISSEFNEMTDEDARVKLPHIKVLARARPLDKLRTVRLLQDLGHVVAVTGDGTNDAPALKQADVGLSMGSSGTEVAKEASKIVLLDDSFATILKAVHWGRSLYENIQRFLLFQLTINASALAIALLGPMLGVKPPFTVLQLLWINVIMDTFAAIALCSEPPRPGLMNMRPKRRDESIITPAMRATIVSTALFFVVVMLGLLFGMYYFDWFRGDGPRSEKFPDLSLRQTTIFFTVYVLFQVWNQINCRSLTPEHSGLTRLYANPIFLFIVTLIVVGQLLMVNLGASLFEATPLSVQDWLLMAAATSSVLVFAELARAWRVYRKAPSATHGH